VGMQTHVINRLIYGLSVPVRLKGLKNKIKKRLHEKKKK
jgi:hypothetical protein